MATHEPAYFDSQASAAAALKIDIHRLREAKKEGCIAFRSGRVYRDELLAWFAKTPERSRPRAADDTFFLFSWEDRRGFLFELNEFLIDAYIRGEITSREFQKLLGGTALLIVKLGRLWKGGIDETGFLANCAWRALPVNHPQRDSGGRSETSISRIGCWR